MTIPLSTSFKRCEIQMKARISAYDFRLRCLFPAAAPQVLFDEYAEHFAVEFRGSITSAFEWNQRQSSSE